MQALSIFRPLPRGLMKKGAKATILNLDPNLPLPKADSWTKQAAASCQIKTRKLTRW